MYACIRTCTSIRRRMLNHVIYGSIRKYICLSKGELWIGRERMRESERLYAEWSNGN